MIVKQNAFLESNPGKLTSIKVEVIFKNHVFVISLFYRFLFILIEKTQESGLWGWGGGGGKIVRTS